MNTALNKTVIKAVVISEGTGKGPLLEVFVKDAHNDRKTIYSR